MEREQALSLCMIVRNEESGIRRCLNSVKGIVDEIVVVDTGSEDATAEICRSFGAKVIDFPWTGSFGEARNAGLREATGDWILWLDADEEVDPVDAILLRDALANDDAHLATVRLINYIGEEPPHPDRAYLIAHHRLFRNFFGFRFDGAIHEQLNVREVLGDDYEVMSLPVKVYHYGYMDVQAQEKNKSERNLSMLLLEKEKGEAGPWVDYHLASEHFRLRDYRRAFDFVNESILGFVKAGEAPPSLLYKLKYETLLTLGSFAGAYPAIDRAISLYPDYVDLSFYKGIILHKLGRHEEALATLYQCLSTGEANIRHLTLRGVGSFHAWYWVGQCQESLGKPGLAVSAYRLCLYDNPAHDEANEALSGLFAKFPELEQGEKALIGISLCMIVKNEEGSIGRVLDSVSGIVDEIVIADTGSTDATKAIAAGKGAKVYDFEWIEHFAAARNFSFAQATKDYIFWLDSDDVLEPKDRLLLRDLKRTLEPHYDTVTMPYNLAFDSAGNVTSSLRRNRLVRRERGFQWHGAVHEYLAVHGPGFASDVAVTHRKDKAYTDRNLRIYRKMQADGAEFSARERYYYANELRDNGLYAEAIEHYLLFLNSKQGWVEDNIQACLKMGDCHDKTGNEEKFLHSLYRTFDYDKPRAEICCSIGRVFLDRQGYAQAIYWYTQATQLPDPPEQLSMSNRSTWTWLPHLQLCLCYDRIGQYEKAFEHNETALSFHPTHASMLYNRNYFKERFGESFPEKLPEKE